MTMRYINLYYITLHYCSHIRLLIKMLTDCNTTTLNKKTLIEFEPRRIAVNPNPNLGLWPFNSKPCHLKDIRRSFRTPSLNTLVSFVFFVMLRTLVWKVHWLTLWPWPLTFEPVNHVTSGVFQDHSIYLVWTLWDHSFLVMLRTNKKSNKHTNVQTDRQTESVGK